MAWALLGAGLMLSVFLTLPSLAAAHDDQFIEALVSREAATSVAAASGPWSAPRTWREGTVPAANAVVRIPAGVTVEYDVGPSDPRAAARLKGIRIEDGGELSFSSDRSAKLTVDTIVGLPGSAFRIGREGLPLRPEHVVEIVFDSGGVGVFDRRSATDPKQFGVGAIFVSNTVQVFGAEKTPFLKSSAGAATGSAEIVLDAQPDGWRRGDSVVVTATYSTPSARTQETREIVSVSGTRVTLSAPLGEDHLPGSDQVPVYVANLTRNVVFRSGQGLSTPTHHRGHMMLMHAGSYRIEGASFLGMGRTRKDVYMDGDGIVDASQPILAFKTDGQGNRLPGPATNIKGRYPLHFHFIQLDPEASDPGVVRRCVVANSPGWGMATHQSYAHLVENVSFDVMGAHFVAEDGNELGEFRGNLAILTRAGGRNLEQHKHRINVHDFGHMNGFWFQGRGNAVIDNVAVGIPDGEAFMWFHRSNAVAPSTAARAVEGLPLEAAEAAESLPLDHVPLIRVNNNTVVGAHTAFDVIKANPDQDHDVRSRFKDLRAFNVLGPAAMFEYTGRYTIDGLTAIRAPWVPPDRYSAGLVIGNNTSGFVVRNAFVKGFWHTFTTPPLAPELWPDDVEDLLLVDVRAADKNGAPQAVTVAKRYPDERWVLPHTDRTQTHPSIAIHSTSDLRTAPLDVVDPAGYRIDWPTSFTRPDGTVDPAWWNYSITRTVLKRDSMPNPWVQSDSFSLSTARFNLVSKGFYTDDDGTRWVPLVGLFTDRLDETKRLLRLWKLVLPAAWRENEGGVGPNLGRPTPPSIREQPVSVSVNRGGIAVFRCGVDGKILPVTYKWFIDDKVIEGARFPTLRLKTTGAVRDGSRVVCEGENSLGMTRSGTATLAITDAKPKPPTSLRLGVVP